jgi:hypothetical protein
MTRCIMILPVEVIGHVHGTRMGFLRFRVVRHLGFEWSRYLRLACHYLLPQ